MIRYAIAYRVFFAYEVMFKKNYQEKAVGTSYSVLN